MDPLITLFSVALAATGLLFLREVRLRKALQRLLSRLHAHWKSKHAD